MENFAYVDDWVWILFAIGVVMVVVSFLFWFKYITDMTGCFILVIGTVSAILLMLVSAFDTGKANRNKTEAKNKVQSEKEQRKVLEASVKDCAEDGYKIYVAGIEVEYDNIDLSKYSIKIDAGKKKIILSK